MKAEQVEERVTRKRHTAAEVAEKLALADRLLQEGRTAGEVAAMLGISKMTYHRWRAAARENVAHTPNAARTGDEERGPQPAARQSAPSAVPAQDTRTLGQLEAENALLRRALGDLFVEKLKLEEMLKFRNAS